MERRRRRKRRNRKKKNRDGRRTAAESQYGIEVVRVYQNCAQAKDSRHGQREATKAVVEEAGEEHTGGKSCAKSEGVGGWKAAAGGADGEAEEHAEDVEYHKQGEGTAQDGERGEKMKGVDVVVDDLTDAAGAENVTPVDEQ
ncbi:hypothetical protein MTO96_021371 [Rhipicephalus appendiculatus]